jgi:uncharacterized membrane protein
VLRADTVGYGSRMSADAPSAAPLAKGLGWFSIALGAAELLAPARVAGLIGVPDTHGNRWVLRAMGVRELSAAPGLFDRPRPAGWLAARVAGDLLDLGLLTAGSRQRGSDRRRVAMAAAAVAGVTVLDVVAANRAKRSADPTTEDGAIRAKRTTTVNLPPDDVYGFWRRLENLPTFMAHLESVEVGADGRSHWKAAAPMGRSVEWDAEIAEDRPGEILAWRSTDGSDLEHHGSVRFRPAPGGRGTEVTVDLAYQPPLGAAGAAMARLFGEDAHQQLADDLRRFKQVVETGQEARSDATPDGSRTQRQVHQDDAQPSS